MQAWLSIRIKERNKEWFLDLYIALLVPVRLVEKAISDDFPSGFQLAVDGPSQFGTHLAFSTWSFVTDEWNLPVCLSVCRSLALFLLSLLLSRLSLFAFPKPNFHLDFNTVRWHCFNVRTESTPVSMLQNVSFCQTE